jgi:hypothetical protein
MFPDSFRSSTLFQAQVFFNKKWFVQCSIDFLKDVFDIGMRGFWQKRNETRIILKIISKKRTSLHGSEGRGFLSAVMQHEAQSSRQNSL